MTWTDRRWTDERLYDDLLAHARRAGWQLGVEPEEVVHEAYLRVLESGREPSPALLHRAVNSVLADWRKALFRRPRPLTLTDWAQTPDVSEQDVAEAAIARVEAERALELLGPYAQVVAAVALGYSLQEVARVQERARAQVRTSYWRACQRVREVLR